MTDTVSSEPIDGVKEWIIPKHLAFNEKTDVLEQLAQTEGALQHLRLHQAQVKKEVRLKHYQRFFDRRKIDFDVELFTFLLQESVRGISDGSYDYVGEDFPFENIKARLDRGKRLQHLQEINHAKDAIGRLAILYYYLNTVLGPLVYSEQYQLQLFDLCDLDASLLPKETKEIKALLSTYLYKRKMLYDFINAHFKSFDDLSRIALNPMIEMIKEHLGEESPLLTGFTPERIKNLFSTKHIPHRNTLPLFYSLSVYAEKRNQTGNFKQMLLGGHSKRSKIGAIDKITAYYRFEEMSLTPVEVSALLEKGSELRVAVSDFLFCFPNKAFDLERDKKKITQLEYFPILDEADTPHKINFRF